LKILFPEADYFIHNDEDCTRQYRTSSYEHYGFSPNLDFSSIHDKNYDYVFIILSSYDILPSTPYYKEDLKTIFDKITEILNQNNFKFVALFDNYDFDYDPNTIITHPKINMFFKRNYNRTKKYSTNVVSFPFFSFGPKNMIEKCDRELVSQSEYFKEKQTRIFFSGTIFSKIDYDDMDIVRDRQEIYSKISNYIYNPGNLDYTTYINEIRNSKFSLDLLGVGDPNSRTFEILMSGSLMISQYNHLLWPFTDGESFSKETIFKNETEFKEIIDNLSNNSALYDSCLQNQYSIVQKYFNKEWLRNYLLSKINI
jgi:hypothetical protein